MKALSMPAYLGLKITRMRLALAVQGCCKETGGKNWVEQGNDCGK